MAYEEKRHQDEGLDLEPILKFIRIILAKWWLVMIFILAFSISLYLSVKGASKKPPPPLMLL